MIPRLYESTETAFSTFGICPLGEATSCIVTEERNGQYVLEMEYPTDGTFFEELKVDRIILSQAHENDTQAQPFRIESISGDMGGIVTINAVHISYQLNWNNDKQYSAGGSPRHRNNDHEPVHALFGYYEHALHHACRGNSISYCIRRYGGKCSRCVWR